MCSLNKHSHFTIFFTNNRVSETRQMSTALLPLSTAHITSHAKFILSAVSASSTRAVVIFFPRTSSAFDFYCRRISRNVIVQRNFFTLPAHSPLIFHSQESSAKLSSFFLLRELGEGRKHTQVLCFFSVSTQLLSVLYSEREGDLKGK